MAKNNIEKLILDRFDRIEKRFDGFDQKLDKVTTEVIPRMREEIATVKADSKGAARVITGVGVLVATAVSTAIAFFKH